jgi:membrane protein implicated in regulation of membrane protease activity
VTNSTLWWLLAGAAVVLELLSGTVYLLLIGIAFAAAAIAAYLGLNLTAQLLVAAVAGVALVLAWSRYRSRSRRQSSQANPDLNLDVGEILQVNAWDADGTALVHYRGAQWTAIARPGSTPTPGLHRIAEITGNRLVLEKI